mgnify:CR=1 FL=1
MIGNAAAAGLDGAAARIVRAAASAAGRWLYCVDAADDLAEDRKHGRFNPISLLYGRGTLTPDEALTFSCTLSAELDAARKKLGINKDNFTVGIFARLEKRKAHEVFLEAARICTQKAPDIRFLVVGDGTRRAELEEMYRSMGLAERVRFCSFCPDIAPLMALCAANVNTSVPGEVSSLAITEGLSLGVPPVVSRCRGNELPDGMDEDKVSSAGLAVMSQLTKGEYEEVYDALREDVREQTSADDIKKMMDAATEGRGSFKKVKDSMVTGVTDADEPHAIAVIGAKYDKKSVVFRIAFDTEMNLIGLDVRGK